jgi:hypothetical protein
VLELDDEQQISITALDADTVMDIEESRSSRRTLELLTGEHAEQIYELVPHQPASVLNGLVADLVDHFGLSTAPQRAGGSVDVRAVMGMSRTVVARADNRGGPPASRSHDDLQVARRRWLTPRPSRPSPCPS